MAILAPNPMPSSIKLSSDDDNKYSKKNGRIAPSYEFVKRKYVFWGRTWTQLDIARLGVVLPPHLLCIFAPFTFTWGALWLCCVFIVITGVPGLGLSYHRNLAHRSFKLPILLEYFFAYCGLHALQGDPMSWVSIHRSHHQYVDTERDPHSPTGGFLHSHITWLFDYALLLGKANGKAKNVGDLEKQAYYQFLRKTYLIHPILLGYVLYALGGYPYLVWGMGVRVVYTYHVTWLINSAGHTWGQQAWNTGDLSRNNWWIAMLTLGEGWHNNHHAFETSAKHGLEWWQIDPTWYMVVILQALGLAEHVKLPTEAQKQKMAFAS